MMNELLISEHKCLTRYGLLFTLAIAAALPSTAAAALLGISLDFPQVSFDNQGTTNYDAGTNAFSVDASPLAIRVAGNPPATITDPESFTINITVDESGHLTGGVPGNDLIMSGQVTVPGLGFISGTLLTGEISGFGFQDSGTTTDSFDFTFRVTGGELASLYPSTIGVVLTSEQSNFSGDFTVDFGGEAKGTLGSLVPLPAAVWLFGSGLLGLIGVARRKAVV